MRKKISAMLLAGCMLSTGMTPIKAETLIINEKAVEYNLPAISLYVNKEKVETTAMNPVQIGGRVLVPTREVFEAMKATVQWIGTNKTVTIKYKSTTVVLTVDKKDALVNGKIKSMDVPAQIINGKVMIPVRFVSEALGMNVAWDSANSAVWISEPVISQPESGGNSSDNNQTVENQTYLGSANNHQLTINAANYEKAKVTEVQVTEANQKMTASIIASSAISDAAISMMPGKVIIDIKNSLSGLATSITPASNTYVKSIRTSQFTADTTRVVLDLKSGALVKASLSADRCKLSIELSSQNLEEMRVTKLTGQDQLFIKGIGESQITVTEDQKNSQIFFTIPNMKMNQSINWQSINSNYISSLSMVQSGSQLTGTIKLKKAVSVSLKNEVNGLSLMLNQQDGSEDSSNEGSNGADDNSGSTGNNGSNVTGEVGLSYVKGSKPVVNLSNITGLLANKIKITDNYRSKQIIFDLGADYSKVLPAQVKTLNDGNVNSIEVATNGTTKITVNTAQIYAYYVYSSTGKIQIQFVKPSDKYSKIVVLDIGHGGSDGGAIANNVKEKDINFNQGMALYRLLEADSNIKVYMTRETDVYPTLQFRAALANEIGADLFISIHNNSAASTVVGTETLYYPSTTDQRSKQVAQLIQTAIVNDCNMINRGIKARSDLYVLRSTNMPAVLLETGFLSNPAEAIKINSPSFISVWAKGVYAAVVKGFEIL